MLKIMENEKGFCISAASEKYDSVSDCFRGNDRIMRFDVDKIDKALCVVLKSCSKIYFEAS